ncbi:MAG: DUF1349 domain-containing protein [Candidatus Dormibacteraeota bacterium]|nr:DUF1349 domain-containing protein [Candidatus Dormibacteraeota bacterium]
MPDVPLKFRWRLPPEHWDLAGGVLTVRAGACTDLFVDPGGAPTVANAPRLLAPAAGDFRLSARVTVDFGSRFDAGVLLLWFDGGAWAKLCLECAPLDVPTVVSVVTRGLSDDCNSHPTDGNSTWLRVTRRGGAFAFHSSADGETWNLVRHFALAPSAQIEVGFMAQSPEGEGCTATFDAIRHRREPLRDLRSGE